MKILCLFVRHGTSSYPGALETLDRWYARHGLTERRTLWVIDNAIDGDAAPAVLPTGAVLRPGDNRAWEFSAWARALREARTERGDFDVVHFVTSAFNTLYTGYLEHFHPAMLDYVVTRNVALGHLDGHSGDLRLGNVSSNAWMRTCFFFLPRFVAQSFAPWVVYRDPAQFFVSPESRAFRPDAPLSPAYQAHLTAWLEGKEIGGHEWHSPVGPDPRETGRYQAKTLAILNEHQLAITLRAAGIRLTDFCWLHAQRDTPPADRPDPPPEPEQLTTRRRILGIPEPTG